MYLEVIREDVIRIPPEYLRRGSSFGDHIDRLASRAFEGSFDEDDRLIVVTYDHESIGRGRIIHGDGAIYQPIRFKAILFEIGESEVVEGAVSEVHEFGAFVRIGPLEALLHVSQIMDERVRVNIDRRKSRTDDGRIDDYSRVEGLDSGKFVQTTDPVRARIVQVSLNTSDPRSSKIGLTCKQPGLGPLSWLGETQEEDG